MMKHVIILFFLALSFSVVSADNFNQRQWMVVETHVQNPVSFEYDGYYIFDYLDVEFKWIPSEDYRQSVEELFLSGEGFLSSDAYNLRIVRPIDFNVEVIAITNQSSKSLPITRKVEFPITNLNQNLLQYIQPTDLIDIDPNIRIKADSIASGKDDLFEVVFEIATWVNSNINYNLSTLESEARLPSSWVLENRQGVCSEMSNLFISMLRSLGIPARFVSGMAYTDSPLFEENWGAHAWVEVYFPGFGWVSFDPTYNQLGFIDSSHIKFNDGVDSSRYPNTFTWLARNVEVNLGALTLDSKIIDFGPIQSPQLDLELVFLEDEISFESYNLITLKVTNTKPYYVARTFNIVSVTNLNRLTNSRQDIFLKPFETKELSWEVYVSTLDQNYVYTFPVVLYSNFGEEIRSNFSISINGKTVSNHQINQLRIIEESSPDFSCQIQTTGYINDVHRATCNFINNIDSICVFDYCYTNFSNESEVSFPLNLSLGFNTYIFKTNTGLQSYVPLYIIDKPNISLDVIGIEDRIKKDDLEVTLNISKLSSSQISNLVIDINLGLYKSRKRVSDLEKSSYVNITIPKELLHARTNTLFIQISFQDEFSKNYTVNFKKDYYVTSNNLFDKMRLYVNLVNKLLVSIF